DGGADLEGAVQGGSVGQVDVGGVHEGAQVQVAAVVGPGDACDGGVGDMRHPEGSGGPRLPGERGGGQGWHVPVPDEHAVVGGQDCCGGEGGEVFGGIQCHAGHVAADPVQFGGGQVAGCFEHVPRVGGGGGYVLACGGDGGCQLVAQAGQAHGGDAVAGGAGWSEWFVIGCGGRGLVEECCG